MLTVIDCVVAPLLHNQEVPADAVSITVLGAQITVGPPADTDAVGFGLTVTAIALVVLVQVDVVTVQL